MAFAYTLSPFAALRRRSRVVRVGDVAVGGANPIRIQSMTNTDTMDTQATVDQIERLAAAGCEIARATAPSIRDAENLAEIKRALARRGVAIPLVADIHFTPNAALIAAEHVEKVRINPGNYADKKKFEIRDYSDDEYRAELERVAERFRPLVVRCRENGVAMRIGTNHGSLSDRIMNRYGDTPLGMVESALEFLDVCEDEGYREVIFSMKASNTHVAIHAYRLLAARLAERSAGEPSYPFHLGVTEAGDSEDGRIKSAMGIGTLLEEGLGDTIRVSLTEDPVREVPVARRIADRAQRRWAEDADVVQTPVAESPIANPFEHDRRKTRAVNVGGLRLGGEEPIRVELDLADAVDWGAPSTTADALAKSLLRLRDVSCEGLLVNVADEAALVAFPSLASALGKSGLALPLAARLPLALLSAGAGPPEGAARIVVPVGVRDGVGAMRAAAQAAAMIGVSLEWSLEAARSSLPELIDRVLTAQEDSIAPAVLFSVIDAAHPHAIRLLAARLAERGWDEWPIVLRYACGELSEHELLEASVDLGMPLCDGLGDAVSLASGGDTAQAVDVAYRILQGARLRTTRTEYISCPSCGRTLFDLEEITARIKQATGHLKGVKIAIMGCIVNGPGEMADADFGYVGSGQGVVTLYVGKQIVARGVPEAEATDRLIALIREHDRWSEEVGAD